MQNIQSPSKTKSLWLEMYILTWRHPLESSMPVVRMCSGTSSMLSVDGCGAVPGNAWPDSFFSFSICLSISWRRNKQIRRSLNNRLVGKWKMVWNPKHKNSKRRSFTSSSTPPYCNASVIDFRFFSACFKVGSFALLKTNPWPAGQVQTLPN